METGIFIFFGTGLLAGIVHVLIGPDHLAAVAPLTQQTGKGNWQTGMWWGIGHTGGVWTIGALAFLFRESLPLEALSSISERLVGVVLIGLGIWAGHRAFHSQLHYHEHIHDGERHAHFHVHPRATSHPPRDGSEHAHSHAPMGIGLLHGLAGSSHLLGVLPALVLNTRAAAVSYVAGFGLGAILAMTAFAWAIGQISLRLMGWSSYVFYRLQLSFAGIAICVGIAWLTVV